MEFFVFPVVARCVLHMMCGCSNGAVTVGGEGEGECFWKKGWAEMDFSGALFKFAIRYAQQWHL